MAFLGERAESLALLAADGDSAAMEELLATIRPAALRVAARFLPYRDDAEDACQAALLAIAQGLPGWRRSSSFSTWAYRVIANRSRATYRGLRRRAVELGHDGAPERPDPRTTSVVAGTRLDLLDGLDALGDELGEAVALRDVLDLEYAEIATLLGVPAGTVKSRIHEGRRRLRARMSG